MAYKMNLSFDELIKNFQEISSPEANNAKSQVNFESVKNTFIDVVKNRLFCYEGTTGRKEFFMYAIAAIPVWVVCDIIIGILTTILCLAIPSISIIINGVLTPILVFWAVPACLFSAIGARRLHETGKSGWLQLLGLIPVIGWAIALSLYLGKKVDGCSCGCGCEQK